MHFVAPLFAILAALLSATLAIQVTSPNQQTTWTIGSGSVTISWTSVSTDPQTIDVFLVNFSRYPNTIIQLKSNVAVSGGTLAIDSTYLQAGTGWQINLVPQGSNSQQILAQSNMFTIAGGSGSNAGGSTPTSTSTASAAVANVAPIVTNGNISAAGITSVPRVSAVSSGSAVQVPAMLLMALALVGVSSCL
jgi:hypothetical protein